MAPPPPFSPLTPVTWSPPLSSPLPPPRFLADPTGGERRTPNRRRRSFTWLQRRVDNSQNWAKIGSCLQDGKVCQKLGDKKETLSQFVNKNLSPIQFFESLLLDKSYIHLDINW